MKSEKLPSGMVFPHSLRVVSPHSLRDGVPSLPAGGVSSLPAGGVPSPDLSQREREAFGNPSPLGEVGRGQTLRSLISQLSCKPNAEQSLL